MPAWQQHTATQIRNKRQDNQAGKYTSMKEVHCIQRQQYSDPQSVVVHFHGFPHLDQGPDEYVRSPTFTLHGLRWFLRLYPRGLGESATDAITSGNTGGYDNGYERSQSFGIFLCLDQASWSVGEWHKAKLSINMPQLNQRSMQTSHTMTNDGMTWGWGSPRYNTRASAINVASSSDGALSFVVSMQLYLARPVCGHWMPKLEPSTTRLNAFHGEKMADLAFVVGRGEDRDTVRVNSALLLMGAPHMQEVIEAATILVNDVDATFHSTTAQRQQHDQPQHMEDQEPTMQLNRWILSSALHQSHGGQNNNTNNDKIDNRNGDESVIFLPDIDPDHFRCMVRFIYADDTSCIDANIANRSFLQGVLVVANRFGCWRLKLVLEAYLIEHHLNECACIELLLFADGHDCAMLKEAAMECTCSNAHGIFRHPDFCKLVGCVELMTAIHRQCVADAFGGGRGDDEKGGSKFDADMMTSDGADASSFSGVAIGDLYRILEERSGLDLESDMGRDELVKLVKATHFL